MKKFKYKISVLGVDDLSLGTQDIFFSDLKSVKDYLKRPCVMEDIKAVSSTSWQGLMVDELDFRGSCSPNKLGAIYVTLLTYDEESGCYRDSGIKFVSGFGCTEIQDVFVKVDDEEELSLWKPR